LTNGFSKGIILFLGICIAAACPSGYGFDASPPAATIFDADQNQSLPDAPPTQKRVMEKGLPLAIIKDQIPIWSSPVRVRPRDLIWLLPLGAATGVTLATDTDTMRKVSHDRTFNKDNVNVSNSLLSGEIAVPVVLYGVGLFKGDAHAREAGLVSGEALVDSIVVEEVTKIILRRERPLADNAAGDFFTSGNGTGSSFPSSHSILAWSAAAVVAGEYPSKWVQAGVYTVATGVSVTRVLGQEHFPTDVLVGAAAGWLIGHYVFTKHSHVHPGNPLLRSSIFRAAAIDQNPE
jgi:membrane-associated phospholipid phosphatase